MFDNNNQNTIEWFRSRLGNITGSAIGNLMGTPRSKNEQWTATALSYMGQIAFERTLNPIVIDNDDLFAQYIALTEIKSKAIEWGHKMEGEAAHQFAKAFYILYGSETYTPYTLDLQEPPSVKNEELPHFSSSPDRMFYAPETGEQCAIEIKCPQGNAFYKYVRNVFLPGTQQERLEGLKKAEANYYWQCYAHMLATGASKTYFVIYNPFQQRPLFSLQIERDENVINLMREKIIAANKYIENLVNKIKNEQTRIA